MVFPYSSVAWLDYNNIYIGTEPGIMGNLSNMQHASCCDFQPESSIELRT